MSRTLRHLTHGGVTRSIPEWSQITGIPVKTLQNRAFDKGWTAERTLTEPVHTNINKTGVSKNDAEMELNETPFEQLHPSLKVAVRDMGYGGTKFGREVRDRCRVVFNKWFDEVYAPSKNNKQTAA